MSINTLGYSNLLTKHKNIYTLSITSISSGATIELPAFITDFSDDFKSNFNTQPIYGKMDPIISFKNTTRSIKVSFDLPSENKDDSETNIRGLEIISRGMYPVYQDTGGGTATITTPPLFRVKFANLIQDASTGNGLLGYFDNFSFAPVSENGFYIYTNNDDPYIVPKLLKCSLTLNVIHEHPLGYKSLGVNKVLRSENNTRGFPHDFAKDDFQKPDRQEATQETFQNKNKQQQPAEESLSDAIDKLYIGAVKAIFKV